jgi:hypothetical protein
VSLAEWRRDLAEILRSILQSASTHRLDDVPAELRKKILEVGGSL